VTAGTEPSSTQLFFLPSSAGDLLACYHPPQAPLADRTDILLLPPFAEEMNKSRRMFTLLAQRLAQQGIGTLLVDLFGTGDSQGDFSEARWDIWRQDISHAVAWLRQQGAAKVHALGLRLGALLALDVQQQGQPQFDGLTLWAPVVNGQMAMTQFLRLRLAASLMGEGGAKETTKELRALLEAGDNLEVAGYEISPSLFFAIDALRLEAMAETDTPPVHWLELVAEEGRGIPPASRKVVDAWSEQGVHVKADCVVGDPFWSMQEITVVPSLLDKTVQQLSGA
jgi:exosortase A-associated hydrolase 2